MGSLQGELEHLASTEPLNCFSGECTATSGVDVSVKRFNGAAELLQRRAYSERFAYLGVGALQRSR